MRTLNAYNIKWGIITSTVGKRIPKTLLKGLSICQLANDTVAVALFKDTVDILKKNKAKLKRLRVITFEITDKQFGLISKPIPGWKGLTLTVDNGVLSITNKQAESPLF